MQLFGRRARADSHGRFHLSSDEMAELYRGFHLALTDTYWETPSNHKICTDAMEAIRTTHISTKSGRFLKNFTALVREVYSHAHYNIQELLYEERDQIRQEYWEKIAKITVVVLKRADHIWSTPCSDKISVLLQFSALYSLYKDVADEDYIQKIYDVAVNGMQFQQTHKNKKDKTDDDKMYDYFDQIQLVYRLRKEKSRSGSISSEPRFSLPSKRASMAVSPAEPLMEHRQSRLATKEELDGFFDKIMKEQQRQRRSKQKPNTADEHNLNENEPQLDMWVSSSSADLPDGRRLSLHVTVTAHEEHEETVNHKSRGLSPGRRHSTFVHLPEIMSVIKKLNPIHHQVKPEEPAPEIGEFDCKAEFEKRFGKRQSNGSITIDLPVIARPNPLDRVTSYRRQGLFNDRNAKHRAGSESNSISSIQEDAKDQEIIEIKENAPSDPLPPAVPTGPPPPSPDQALPPDNLAPPPKPPRSFSPHSMEKLIVEAIVNGSQLDESVQV